MEQADALYRAFIEYRKVTKENPSCARTREAIRKASAENDRLKTVSARCIIKDDWVNRIYEGLEYIEKAIAEERQFIRQQGEVVPIEKVRRVSKGSVEHLARHSELMTHEPEEDGKLIPDKIFMVEKLSDYAVYENRFLYMLLCYLRDFIEIRYSKIVELGNTYRAEFDTNKEITVGKRTITYKANFRERSKEDPYGLTGDKSSDGLMKKIEEERHLVAAFLMTPLMKKVAESPMLKPPITRTNALRMDVNFKGAVELYDYIVAYDSDGYTIEYDKKEITPFSEKVGDEFAEFISMTAFLTYKYGKNMESVLEAAYQAEEKRRAEEREQEYLRQIKELRKRIADGCGDPERYMLMLEERNAKLEKLIPALAAANQKIKELEETVSELRKQQAALLNTIEILKAEIAKKEAEIEEMKIRHKAECEAIKAAAEKAIADAAAENAARMAEFKAKCEAELKAALEENAAKLKAAIEENDAKLKTALEENDAKLKTALEESATKLKTALEENAAKLKTAMETNDATLKAKIAENDAKMKSAIEASEAKLKAAVEEKESKVKECDERVTKAEKEAAELREKYTLTHAQLLAQKKMNGTIASEGDFTEKDRFNELEKEYLALSKLIEEEWKKTKKRIRKRVLWKKLDP